MKRRASGRHRAARCFIIVLLLAGVAALTLDHMAAAAPRPPPTPTSTPIGPTSTSSPTTPSPGPIQPTTPGTPVPDPTAPEIDRPRAADGAGVLGPLTATDPDKVPLDHYDITGDEGAWNHWGRKLLLLGTDGTFAITRMLVGLEAWALNWAFEFGPAEALLAPARTVATTYQRNVIDRLGLPGFLLTLAAAWCGIQIMRGRTSRGVGELLVTLVIAALAATVLARPADLLLADGGLLGQTRDTSMALASVTSTGGRSDSSNPHQVAKPLTDTLIRTFVIEPHQLLNYGKILDDPDHPDKCLFIYKAIVREGPWGGDDTPRNWLTTAGCDKLAAYNHDPSWDRFIGANLLLIAVLVVGVLILLMIGVLMISVFSLAVYAITGNAAALIALLPGGARGVLWRWVGGVAKVVLVIIAVVVFIPLFALFIRALLHASSDQPLVARFFLIDLAAAAGLVFHRKLVAFGTRAGYRVSRRLELSRYGGTRGLGWGSGGAGGYGYGGYGALNAGWLGGGNPAGLSPISAAELHRGARQEIRRITAPAQAAARGARRAWVGPRQTGTRAVERLPRSAGRLRTKLTETRGGRVMLRTTKSATFAGKIAFASTVGAPVAAPRAATKVRAAARVGSAAMKRSLTQAATHQSQRARQYGNHWARNTGLAATARTTHRLSQRATATPRIAATIATAPIPKDRPSRPRPAAHAPAPPHPATTAPPETASPQQSATLNAAELRRRLDAQRNAPPPPRGDRPPRQPDDGNGR